MAALINLVKLITLFFLVFGSVSAGGDWNAKLKLTTLNFTVDYQDPSVIQVYPSVTNDGVMNVAYHIVDGSKLTKDLTVVLDVSTFDGTNYKKIDLGAFALKQNFCEFLRTDKMFAEDFMKHIVPQPTTCPWGNGWWNMTDYTPKGDKIPNFVPEGQYRTKMNFNMGTTTYYATSWYGILKK